LHVHALRRRAPGPHKKLLGPAARTSRALREASLSCAVYVVMTSASKQDKTISEQGSAALTLVSPTAGIQNPNRVTVDYAARRSLAHRVRSCGTERSSQSISVNLS